MILIYFATSNTGAAKKIQNIAENTGAACEVYRRFRSLSTRLRELKQDIIGVIALASDHDELSTLIKDKELLLDVPLILILPDNAMTTHSQARRLRPRLLMSVEDNLMDLEQVLHMMVHKVSINTPLPYESQKR
ncbi:hypothetical protein [Desulfobacter latus]|uniref:Uncharacterized protein n=1 Tax=Desulfobacter latus TaxID=2292 RepID=A0A850T6Z5_9BACT|nr:hypothetical protein [Desulfobacter latus]NWH05172.1 hypothetical protein [Desulfobacter latus]